MNALRHALLDQRQQQTSGAGTVLQDNLNRALTDPGGPLARRLLAALNVMCWALPVAAMIWIAFRVVAAFVDGGSNPAQYLGSNFAVNGFLLLLFAWMIPASLHATLSPTREQSALQGLNLGLGELLAQNEAAVALGIDDLDSDSSTLKQQYERLWAELPALENQDVPEQIRRLIIDQMAHSSSRDLDVRASTHTSTDEAPVS